MDSPNPPLRQRARSTLFSEVKFYRYRQISSARQWWLLALTIGLGLAWKGWYLFNLPEFLRIHRGIERAGGKSKGSKRSAFFRMEYYEEYVGNTMRSPAEPGGCRIRETAC